MEPSWLGRRVSVRRAAGRGDDGRARFSDVVGDLIALNERTASVDTRDGVVQVELDSVALARVAPPSTADELALEAVAAAGWRPEQTGAIGGWVLRAASGFSSRANSVLPLRAPGLPLDDALEQARAWYAGRGLPLSVAVPAESRRLLDAELGERGWPADSGTEVLAARLDLLRAGIPPGEPGGPDGSGRPGDAIEVTTTLGADWLSLYRGGAALAPAARALLTRHDRVGFAAVRRGGRTVAVGRGVVDERWLGISAVEVDPAHRRQGLATAVMSALCSWGAARGARRSYLQVTSDNSAALALYARLGYWQHHSYHYRRDPQP